MLTKPESKRKSPGTVHAALSLLLLTALATAAPTADPEDEKPPAATTDSKAAPLLYLGLNAKGHEEWLRVKDDAVVIRIPGGEFRQRPYQGSAATEEPEAVDVASFFMDKFEVTNTQFARFLNAGEGEIFGVTDMKVPGLVRDGSRWKPAPGLGRHPVTCANGSGALAYARWAGAALPSQVEWEKAAGGPEGRLYPWGDAPPDASRANGGRTGLKGAKPVGSHPAGASPYGCLDMAGNVYDRVLTSRGGSRPLPVMLKGASWASYNPLNLRVLDLCMQPMGVAERTVGFRCVTEDPSPDRPTRTHKEPPVLRLARDFDAAVEEARTRKVPLFLSLLHDTCGQCDRTIAQCYRDPRFVKYCNENMVVVLGHQPWDADDAGHKARADGSCPLHAGLTCKEHEELYRRGLAVVGGFATSPGNFVLHPGRTEKGARGRSLLVPERGLPKWGNAVETYLEAFDEARSLLREE